MKRISSKKALLIFYGFDIILVLVLLLLFLPLSKKNIPETSKMKFISNAKEISSVEIYNAQERKKIIIFQKDNIWLGTDDDSNMTLNWPCDIQTIKNFLAEAEKENILYKKAEKVSSWARLGVDEKNSCRITFFKNGSEKVSEFFFGIEDFKLTVVRSTIVKILMTLFVFLFVKESNCFLLRGDRFDRCDKARFFFFDFSYAAFVDGLVTCFTHV